MVMVTATDRQAPSTGRQGRFAPLFALDRQAGVTKDLFAFFGPDPDVYLEVYDEMRRPKGPTAPVTWSWPVFFVGFAWFFYRKLYVWGAALILVPIIADLLFGIAGAGVLAIAAILTAKGTYVRSTLRRIQTADELGLSGDERARYLERAGGVSVVAAVFSGILLALFYLALVVGIATSPLAR
jgi:hypothetical protein